MAMGTATQQVSTLAFQIYPKAVVKENIPDPSATYVTISLRKKAVKMFEMVWDR